MIELLRTWLLGLIATALCLTVLEALVPKGALRSIAQITGGLVLLVALLQPWLQVEIKELELSYDEYRRQMDDYMAEYRGQQSEQMKTIIEAETAAYIWEKGRPWGLEGDISVTAEERQGIWIPAKVKLSSPYRADVAVWLSQELAIPETAQEWGESG